MKTKLNQKKPICFFLNQIKPKKTKPSFRIRKRIRKIISNIVNR